MLSKIVLSDQTLYSGDINLPKGYEIDKRTLIKDILSSNINNEKFPFSKTWDQLNTYIRENINVEHNISLITKETWGNTYKPFENSEPLLNVDPVDLRHSPDFTVLYGVKTKNCNVRIYFDHNRRKGRSWDVNLKSNMFIMFPSTNLYHISNSQEDNLNIIQTITYEYP